MSLAPTARNVTNGRFASEIATQATAGMKRSKPTTVSTAMFEEYGDASLIFAQGLSSAPIENRMKKD
jgi:hypothetical protein